MNMNATLSIGQLARQASVPTSTLRYYEKAGLLEPEGRSEGNYRVYGPESMKRLLFIKAAQSAGFTLEDIASLMEIRDGRASPCTEVKDLIEHRLVELQKKLQDLHHVQDVLISFMELCGHPESKDHCEVLDKLNDSPSGSCNC